MADPYVLSSDNSEHTYYSPQPQGDFQSFLGSLINPQQQSAQPLQKKKSILGGLMGAGQAAGTGGLMGLAKFLI